MQQNNTSVASTRPASLLNHPISQATVTGALTLIPTRKYPTWLRHSLIWGPAVACLAGSVYLIANPKTGSKTTEPRKNTGRADQDYLPSARLSGGRRARHAVTMVALGGGIGTLISLTTAAGFWADEKIEQSLGRLNVPFPRAIMGIAAGALTWCQAKQSIRQQQ